MGRRGKDDALAALGVFSLSGFLVAGTAALLNLWGGGWSYGYRTSSECALLLLPPFALVARRLRARWPGRALLALLLAASVGIHALEYAFPNDHWNANPRIQDRPQILVHFHYAGYRLGLLSPDL